MINGTGSTISQAPSPGLFGSIGNFLGGVEQGVANLLGPQDTGVTTGVNMGQSYASPAVAQSFGVPNSAPGPSIIPASQQPNNPYSTPQAAPPTPAPTPKPATSTVTSGGSTASSGTASASATPASSAQSNQNYQNYVNAQSATLGQLAQQQIQDTANQYAAIRAQIDAQKNPLQQAYNLFANPGGTMDTAVNQANNLAQSQSDLLRSNTNQALNTQNTNLQDIYGQNNRLAGAYGGLNSGLIQENNLAARNFSNNVGGIQNTLTANLNDIGTNLKNFIQNMQLQKAQLYNDLQNNLTKISLDENASDAQKAQAIDQIKGNYQQQMSALNNQQLQQANALQLAQAQAQVYMAMYGKAPLDTSSAQNPYANLPLANPTFNPTQGLTALNTAYTPFSAPTAQTFNPADYTATTPTMAVAAPTIGFLNTNQNNNLNNNS